jgi:hypothetical protein
MRPTTRSGCAWLFSLKSIGFRLLMNQGRRSPRFRSRYAAGGSSCRGGLSSQISSASLSQNSSERVINSNAINHAGCRRRQASHGFHCSQRSCRLVILHTHPPGDWFGRRGRSEDAPARGF